MDEEVIRIILRDTSKEELSFSKSDFAIDKSEDDHVSGRENCLYIEM